MMKLVQERIGKTLIAVIISSLAIYLFAMYALVDPKDEGTANSVQRNQESVKAYLENMYKKKSIISISAGQEHKLNSPNYDQTVIKDYYNFMKSQNKIPKETGVCWAAAQASVLKFNGVTGTGKEIGYRVLDRANFLSYWDGEGSFDFAKADSLLTTMFSCYHKNKKGNNDRYDIYDTLCDEIDNGRVCIFKIVNHEMTGCGYVTYTIRYSQKNVWGKTVKKTEKQDFVIVNDTWSDNSLRQYSYFPECEIGTNVFSRWDFGITKVRKK
ncbi:MAG: hypothetical protein Q4C48_09280 [Lachnospiraceae bacterium]|nr:hypothetical protein [Lachnospiraceae bacterium]